MGIGHLALAISHTFYSSSSAEFSIICQDEKKAMKFRMDNGGTREKNRDGGREFTANKHSNSEDCRRAVAVICLCLAAITFAVFGRTFRYGFVNYDDAAYVYENEAVQKGLSLEGVGRAFTHVHAGNWHPLTTITHMLDVELYGLNAGGHHLTNVVLHSAAAILLFLALRSMTGALWRAAFVAAVFAVHPLRVESVAWVAERKDVLSGLFFMLTIWAYARYARPGRSVARYWAVFFLYAAGLLCKPMLVTLPFVLLLLDFWPLGRFAPMATGDVGVEWRNRRAVIWRLVKEKIPLMALAAAACVATLTAQKEGIRPLEQSPLSLRLANAMVSCVIYLKQMVFPGDLAAFYPYPIHGLPVWEVAAAALLLGTISTGAVLLWRRQPWWLTGWFWYLGMLVPVIGLVHVGDQAHADRYTYLPQIGIYVAGTWAAGEWCRMRGCRRLALGSAMAGVIGILMVLAWKQTAYWKDSEILWTHALNCTSSNATACNNLGISSVQNNRIDEATHWFERALEIQPDYAEAHYGLGTALLQKGDVDGAVAEFKTALKLDPDDALACNNLGLVYFQRGQTDAAISEFEKALKIRPDFAEPYCNLGLAYFGRQHLDDAMACFRKALELQPGLAEAHFDLGNAWLQKGDAEEAAGQFQKAVAARPKYATARNALGDVLRQMGRLTEAAVQYEKVLELDPGNANAHYNLGNALLQEGRPDEAIVHFQKTLELQPHHVAALVDLGAAFQSQGRLEEAAIQYQKGLEEDPRALMALNNLAWVLATSPKESLRDGVKAIKLAQQANQLGGGENPIILHTLAAAYAETGRFSEAEETAEKALRLAESQADAAMAEAIRKEIALYRSGSPIREANQSPALDPGAGK